MHAHGWGLEGSTKRVEQWRSPAPRWSTSYLHRLICTFDSSGDAEVPKVPEGGLLWLVYYLFSPLINQIFPYSRAGHVTWEGLAQTLLKMWEVLENIDSRKSQWGTVGRVHISIVFYCSGWYASLAHLKCSPLLCRYLINRKWPKSLMVFAVSIYLLCSGFFIKMGIVTSSIDCLLNPHPMGNTPSCYVVLLNQQKWHETNQVCRNQWPRGMNKNCCSDCVGLHASEHLAQSTQEPGLCPLVRQVHFA